MDAKSGHGKYYVEDRVVLKCLRGDEVHAVTVQQKGKTYSEVAAASWTVREAVAEIRTTKSPTTTRGPCFCTCFVFLNLLEDQNEHTYSSAGGEGSR